MRRSGQNFIGSLHEHMAAEGGWVVWGFGDSISLKSKKVSDLPKSGSRYDVSKVTISS